MRTAQHETAERMQIVNGVIASDGTVLRGGRDFTIFRTSAGIYTARWTFVAKAIVNVVASAMSGTGGLWVIVDTHSGVPLGPQEFLIKSYTNAVGLADTNWGFTALVIPQCV